MNVGSTSKRIALAVLLAAASGFAVAADTSANSPAKQAYIPFANHGGILDWQVVDDSTLLIQDRHGQWYLAKVVGPAFALPATESLGFVTEPSGTLQKLSSIVVRGQRYPIISLTRTDPPASKRKK